MLVLSGIRILHWKGLEGVSFVFNESDMAPGLLEARVLPAAIILLPALRQNQASLAGGISIPRAEDHEAFRLIDERPTPLPVLTGRAHRFDKFFTCHRIVLRTLCRSPASREAERQVHRHVYAQHGRELMGCKSPVCEPVYRRR